MCKLSNPIVFLFSGQGSQYHQMGLGLYRANPRFKYWLDTLDEMVIKLAGFSVLKSLYATNVSVSTPLKDIELSHPAIVMVEYALAKSLIEQGVKPDYLLGASLGEFTAAAIAGVIDVETLLTLVLHQANHLDLSESAGAMIAVLENDERLSPLIAEFNCELAGRNYASHCLVAGSNINISLLQKRLKQLQISFLVLPVEYAFHSSLLDHVKDKVLPFIAQQAYAKPEIAFISCAEATEIVDFNSEHLWNVIRKPIEFSDTVKNLQEKNNYCYVDLGPSSTLSNFVKYNLGPDDLSTCISILDPFGDDNSRYENAITRLKPEQSKTMIDSADDRYQIKDKDTHHMKAFVFPGQGSQFKGMGKELFKKFPQQVQEADAILGYSIEKLCLDDPQKQLSLTQFTQPALYVVSALTFLDETLNNDSYPDVVAGHSLGEYSALFAAGVFDFATGLKLVQKRGQLMSQINIEGGMAAILNSNEASIKAVLEKSKLVGIDIANFNTPRQTVIAGLKKELIAAEKAFQRAQTTFVPLNVSAPFHSRYMEAAVESFSRFLDQFAFSEPQIPVIANVTARPYQSGQLKYLLSSQISNSVRWTDTIDYLLAQGIEEYKELGPGEVLTKMVATIKSGFVPGTIPKDEDLFKNYAGFKNIVSASTNIENSAPTPETPIHPVLKSGFTLKFGCQYNYVLGAIGGGISSEKLVIQSVNAGFMAYYGAAHTSLGKIGAAIDDIKLNLSTGKNFGVNIHSNLADPKQESDLVDLLLERKVDYVEATGFFAITPALVRYRIQSVNQLSSNNILARVETLSQAVSFMQPAPADIIAKLLYEEKITTEQARLAATLPMADAIAFHGDLLLLQELLRLRNSPELRATARDVFIGSSKSIGAPQSIATAIMNGAEFVLSDTIHQCTVESGLHIQAKELLQHASVTDVKLTPCTEFFEFGRKISVLSKGSVFPSKAKKIYDIWKNHESIENLSKETIELLNTQFFPEGITSTFTNTHRDSYLSSNKSVDDKTDLTALLKTYFRSTTQQDEARADWCITCGPEMGALNQWLNREKVIPWHKRNVDRLSLELISETNQLLANRLNA